MILLSNSSTQSLTVGQSVNFDTILFQNGESESCKNTATRTLGSVKLRKCGVYEITFSGNVGSTADDTQVQLTIAINGVALPETVMSSYSTTADDYNNVSTSTIITNSCSETSVVTVINSGTSALNIGSNSSLLIKRIA